MAHPRASALSTHRSSNRPPPLRMRLDSEGIYDLTSDESDNEPESESDSDEPAHQAKANKPEDADTELDRITASMATVEVSNKLAGMFLSSSYHLSRAHIPSSTRNHYSSSENYHDESSSSPSSPRRTTSYLSPSLEAFVHRSSECRGQDLCHHYVEWRTSYSGAMVRTGTLLYLTCELSSMGTGQKPAI